VLGAVDHGYRVIVVTDAVCSSSDEGHDAMLKLYRERYSLQIEAVRLRGHPLGLDSLKADPGLS